VSDAPKLNADFDNVYVVETTVADVRDDTFLEDADFTMALDNAQGRVFTAQSEVAFVVIEIRRKKE
jgi:hypothetical protein